MMESIVHDYLRPHKGFPHVWCPGCSDGIIVSSIVRAIHKTGIERDKLVMVSGIGCSSRAPIYLDFSSLHGTHGRAICFATGIKLAHPELTVVVITGDGDSLAIGGNHFIHACRRNIDITVILFNNGTYGMTGGQMSPTMNIGDKGPTTPFGNVDRAFDVVTLATAAGATFVARASSYNPVTVENAIKKGIQNKGLSIIDVVATCPEVYGFYNKTGNGIKMLKTIDENTVSKVKAETMTEKELDHKVVVGTFVEKEGVPEYSETYRKLFDISKKVYANEESI